MRLSEKPCRLIGFDIHIRICWDWPSFRCRVGKVWRILGYNAIKHQLPPA